MIKRIAIHMISWAMTMSLLFAQQPDYLQEYFFPQANVTPPDPSVEANSMVYCDGENIAVLVQVKDPHIQIAPNNRLSDHVRLWLALPQKAYPENFDYDLHPDYICADGYNRGQGRSRFFSVYGEYTQQISLDEFIREYDYPSIQQRRIDSTHVPPQSQLSAGQLHYGIVGYDFFPDGRDVEQVNKAETERVGNVLGQPFGILSAGIKYTADFTESKDGYIINAQISPQALGYVQVPEMNEIRMLIEILDAPRNGTASKVVLSSSSQPNRLHPKSFSRVFFQQPLKTEISQIPNQVLRQIDYQPIYFYGKEGWTASGVDVDGLVFSPKHTSEKLTEVLFYPQQIDYRQNQYGDIPVETLQINLQYVNQWARNRIYTFIMDQILKMESEKTAESLSNWIQSDYFRFPDGSIGKISLSSSPLDPYSWDGCDSCEIEVYQIQRIGWNGVSEVLSIKQITAQSKRVQIGNLQFPSYVLTNMIWIKEGQILVLELSHESQKAKRRIKVTWEDGGQNPVLDQID